jgi:hypothetical protein
VNGSGNGGGGESAEGAEPDDGFRWTDVDGFYGRKNSIPLQQLLANDLALLNGVGVLKNGWFTLWMHKHSYILILLLLVFLQA